ncbi:Uncharacterized ABC transporter ATP-binding protein YadG [Durusdinium trenchii]|uniref:Uncharacterized ABC transporter ATP-binding protein YadG n=1 Tax=Durusdinium trenchii TaxID=1381693 RepID=A0ABP0LTN4_9DINO
MALLTQFGLEKFARSKNEALSKGMAQKVQLLSTIAHEPELLILDEPFSGLDPINQQTLEELIRDQQKAGRTIIFSTHVMQHAERLCDRFLIIAHGSKRFEGTLSQARASFAKRVHVRTSASVNALTGLGGVASLRVEEGAVDGDETTYEITLEDGADPQDYLKRAVGAGMKLTRYEQAGATLHDIFMALAGDESAIDDTPSPMMEDFTAAGGFAAAKKSIEGRLNVAAAPFELPRPAFRRLPLPDAVANGADLEDINETLRPFLLGETQIRLEGEAPQTVFAAVLIPADFGAHKAAPAAQYWSRNLTDQALEATITAALDSALRREAISEFGLSQDMLDEVVAIDAPVTAFRPDRAAENAELGLQDRIETALPAVLTYMLLVIIFGVGNLLLTNTIEERSNKIVEILLSSVTANQLMMGKLVGIAAVGLTMPTIFLFGALAVSATSDAQSYMGPVMLIVFAPLPPDADGVSKSERRSGDGVTAQNSGRLAAGERMAERAAAAVAGNAQRIYMDDFRARAALGIVPQEINTDVFFTPKEALDIQAGLYGVPKDQRRSMELLAALGLEDKADSYVRQLSGGMKRRLLVAKAMIHSPPILILDEPTAGVDIELRKQLWDYVLELHAAGVTIVLTTHYLEEAQELCDQIAIIHEGEVVACEPTEKLIASLDRKTLMVTPLHEIAAAPDLGVFNAEVKPDGRLAIPYQPSKAQVGEILEHLSAANIAVKDLSTVESDLEDVFLELTYRKAG